MVGRRAGQVQPRAKAAMSLAVSCPTGKDAARMRASQQFPAFSSRFKLVKNDGVAEATLIALYGAMVMSGSLGVRAAA